VNVVHVDLPEPGPGGADRYGEAARLLQAWRSDGTLLHDNDPAFYVYRMGWTDAAGRAHQTSGVLGALEVTDPGHGDVLPHEETTPKDRTDRLSLTQATRANLSPIWGLSLASGLTALCELPGPPLARWTDGDGVHHRLYGIDEPGVLQAISSAVAASPVLIADGHHRYDVAREYRAEVGPGPADLTLAFIVELAADQLDVRAIHRILSEIPNGVDVVDVLGEFFETFDAGPVTSAIEERMIDAGALCLVTPGGEAWFLRPRPSAFDGVADLDSARLAHALTTSRLGATVSYQHGVDRVLGALVDDTTRVGILVRPVTIDQIAATAHDRVLMPPKSTFFAPKPRSGVVMRSLVPSDA
jgi:uncharacterized protein (DUF1015 family)